ncbi:MAG: gluconate:H+ symporter [Bacteroidota bacterium]
MPLVIVLIGIICLLLLTVVLKLNPFISFIIICLGVGIGSGLEVQETVQSIQTGIGNTLGYLVMILGLGAMLGKLVADGGAAQRITEKLVQTFGLKNVQWAVVLAGFIVGIPMFYTVGFVILIPLVYTIAASTGLPLIYVGLPMLSALSVTHGFLPPHPAPTAIAQMFNANIGQTILYGILIAIPTIILAGPLFARTIKKVKGMPLKAFHNPKILQDHEMPGFGISLFTALLPVLLIVCATLSAYFLPEDLIVRKVLTFVGDPSVAMLLSVLVAIYTLGIAQGNNMTALMQSITQGVTSITMILLIIGGAGAFKQILIDTGAGDYIAAQMVSLNVSPLVLGWLIAAFIRVCVGSATVAGMTASGIIFPFVENSGVQPELMVIAIGAGSLMLSHVNDGGFWLFKEYFNLTIKETLSTWTVMETIVGVMGLIGVLVLNAII